MQSENKTMGEMINAYYESITVTKSTKTKSSKTKSAKSKSSKKLITNKEVIRFGKWYGFEQNTIDITPILIEEYSNKILANNLSTNVNSVQELRKFIRFINPKLTTGLRLKRKQTFNKSVGILNASAELSTLTKAGHKAKSQELEELKKGRIEIAEQIKIAAADKDVRENVPLEAAREQLGHTESRIRVLENTLMDATIIDLKKGSKKTIKLGSTISLLEIDSKKRASYTLVSVTEAKKIQKNYFYEYNTTLNGMIKNHKIDANEFLEFVHDIDIDFLKKDLKLDEELKKLDGKKIIFTNGSKKHALNVTQRIGIDQHFDDIFDIMDSNFVPKPAMEPYKKLVEKHKIDPNLCAFVEDIARNLKPAYEMGMITVWIENDEPWAKKFSDANFINFKTNNLSEFLKKINLLKAA